MLEDIYQKITPCFKILTAEIYLKYFESFPYDRCGVEPKEIALVEYKAFKDYLECFTGGLIKHYILFLKKFAFF